MTNPRRLCSAGHCLPRACPGRQRPINRQGYRAVDDLWPCGQQHDSDRVLNDRALGDASRGRHPRPRRGPSRPQEISETLYAVLKRRALVLYFISARTRAGLRSAGPTVLFEWSCRCRFHQARPAGLIQGASSAHRTTGSACHQKLACSETRRSWAATRSRWRSDV